NISWDIAIYCNILPTLFFCSQVTSSPIACTTCRRPHFQLNDYLFSLVQSTFPFLLGTTSNDGKFVAMFCFATEV
ncbi:MAG: hypothetical protein AB2693_23385, partial [Candidatus Thiodiazotropha sp.]